MKLIVASFFSFYIFLQISSFHNRLEHSLQFIHHFTTTNEVWNLTHLLRMFKDSIILKDFWS